MWPQSSLIIIYTENSGLVHPPTKVYLRENMTCISPKQAPCGKEDPNQLQNMYIYIHIYIYVLLYTHFFFPWQIETEPHLKTQFQRKSRRDFQFPLFRVSVQRGVVEMFYLGVFSLTGWLQGGHLSHSPLSSASRVNNKETHSRAQDTP